MTPKTTRRREHKDLLQEYLQQPYSKILIPEEDGSYTAEILEFPGCRAEGKTADEATRNLDETAKNWIMAALDQGQDIPGPFDVRGFSGRLALRIPRSLHKQMARIAERDNSSLNQFIVSALAEKVGVRATMQRPVRLWHQINIQFEAHAPPQVISLRQGDFFPFSSALFQTASTKPALVGGDRGRD